MIDGEFIPDRLENEFLHTEELHDIITAPPSWLIRWGIGIFFVVFVSVIATSALIRYPDVIKTPIVIELTGGATQVVAGASGQLEPIIVQPSQLVQQGATLAYLKNGSDYQQTLTLLSNLLAMRNDIFTGKRYSDGFLKNIDVARLGELQQSYQSFYLSYMSIREFVKTRKWNSLSQFIQDLNKLIVELQQWKRKYVLIAPRTGKVHFSPNLHTSQIVNAGQELFYINAEKGYYFGQANISSAIVGKLKTGQKVIVKINELPFEKYGDIEGRIKSISEFPLNNGKYLIMVSFDKSDKGLLKSSHLRTGMLANAEITTQDVSLFNRMTNSLFKNAIDKI